MVGKLIASVILRVIQGEAWQVQAHWKSWKGQSEAKIITCMRVDEILQKGRKLFHLEQCWRNFSVPSAKTGMRARRGMPEIGRAVPQCACPHWEADLPVSGLHICMGHLVFQFLACMHTRWPAGWCACMCWKPEAQDAVKYTR